MHRGQDDNSRTCNLRRRSGVFREPTRRLELLTCCLQIRRNPVYKRPPSSVLPISAPTKVHPFHHNPWPSMSLATDLATRDQSDEFAYLPKASRHSLPAVAHNEPFRDRGEQDDDQHSTETSLTQRREIPRLCRSH